ncbi:MAG: endonuclease/exonuclease/phosphatase family protein [Pirellulales bacterium]
MIRILGSCFLIAISSQFLVAQQIQIATYNINYSNRRLDLVVEAINESAADVVVLQETTLKSEEFLRTKLSTIYPHFTSFGHNGAYLAERFAFASKNRLNNVRFIPPRHGLFGFCCAELQLHGQAIQLINIHLSPVQLSNKSGLGGTLKSLDSLEQVHQAELEMIIDHVNLQKPIVLSGDFNSISKSKEQDYLRKLGFIDAHLSVNPQAEKEHTWQWPTATLPLLLRLDYVFHSSHLKAIETKVIRRAGSDHFLVHSTLELK